MPIGGLPTRGPSQAVVQLLPIESVALPQNYKFSVNVTSGRVPSNHLCIEATSDGHATCIPLWKQGTIHESGFTELLYSLLEFANQYNLWGRSVACHANFAQSSGAVMAATRSAPQSLMLPRNRFVINIPNKIEGVGGLNSLYTNPPLGLRIFWGLGSSPNSSQVGGCWYVDAGNRLCTQDGSVPLDRLSFWLSALGIPIKSSQNVTTAEALAFRLGGVKPDGGVPMSGPLSQILANSGPNGVFLQHSMLWNQSRVVMFRVGSTGGFCEFGPTGYSQSSFDEWPSREYSSTLWSVRRLPAISVAYTKASLI